MSYLTLTQLVTQIEEDISKADINSWGYFEEMRRSLQLSDQPQNKKPAITVTRVHGEEHYQVVKNRLCEYFDSAFYEEETPPALKTILDSLERSARFPGLQHLYHKEIEEINQFAVVRPWMQNSDSKNPYMVKAFTIILYEVPKNHDGSKAAIVSGVGEALVRAGIIT
jgi:hypothetical protein